MNRLMISALLIALGLASIVTSVYSNSVKNLDGKTVRTVSLNEDNVVFVVGPIMENAADIAAQVTRTSQSQKEVWVLINSPGGSVLDGALIISAIEASPVPVYTVCMQLCASMAAIIHQYGTERYMIDRSILMFHPASGAVMGTLEQMNSRLKYITAYINKIDTYISKRAGLELSAFKASIVSELWIDAEDALAQKFADQLVNLDLDAEIPAPVIFLGPREKKAVDLNW